MRDFVTFKPWWKKAAAILGCWTLLALFFTSQLYLGYYYNRYPISWRGALVLSFSDWYPWAILSPAILWLSHRFPLDKWHWRGSLLVHLSAGAGFTVVKLIMEFGALHFLTAGPVRPMSPMKFHPNLLTYWAVVGVGHAIDYYSKYRERELRASQLEARLAQAQLEVLKMQLHPHFLFNTLHAISALMHRDVEAADRMLARLSELLRLTIENTGVEEVPLKQELDFLQRYLEIEQTRFGERLAVRMEIESKTLDAQVPNLILQPLVENAVRHGIAPRSSPGSIEIRARQRDGSLVLEVSDDGPGLADSNGNAPKRGVGLANTRARLEQLWGERAQFHLTSPPGKGVTVQVIIPFHTDANEAPPGSRQSNEDNPRADR